MKIKRQTIFLIAGLLLLAASGFLFSRRAIPVSSQSQAVALSDWIYRSGGNLNVMVTYPEKLETGRKNLITVAYQADKALEAFWQMGSFLTCNSTCSNRHPAAETHVDPGGKRKKNFRLGSGALHRRIFRGKYFNGTWR